MKCFFRTGITTLALVLSHFGTPAAFGSVIDQEGFDVRLLGAGLTSRTVKVVSAPSGADQIGVAACQETGRHARYSHGAHVYDYVDLDCTAAIRQLLGVPLVSTINVTAHMEPDTSRAIDSDPLYSGQVVEFLTVARQAAFDASTGIGFFVSSGNRWVSKGDLSQVLTATMANGEVGVVHRFATFFTGQPLSNLMFKPFISFSDEGNIYNNWEDTSPRAGRDFVTGSGFGSGNFQLISGRIDTIANRDLLRDPNVVVFPGSTPVLGEVRGETQAIDIVTATLGAGKISYEAALYPYVYGATLYFGPQGFVEAGKRLWIRVNDANAQGRTVTLRYAVDGGEEQEASYYMGGNCFGFARCFEVKVPDTAQAALNFRVLLTGADGSVFVVDAGGGIPFATAIMPKTDAKIAVSAAGVQTERLQAGAIALLSYDVQRAVTKTLAQGSYPSYIQVKARVKHADGSSVIVPMGGIGAGRDSDFRVTYRGNLGILPIAIKAGATQVDIEFLLECSRFGDIERIATDPVTVSIQ